MRYSVRGRVVLADGSGVPGADVTLRAAAGSVRVTTTDHTGRFHFGWERGERPSSFALSAETESGFGAIAHVYPIASGSRSMRAPDLILRPGGDLRVVVTGLDGPCSGAEVVIGERSQNLPVRLGRCDAAGTWSCSGIPPGEYWVAVARKGMGRAESAVEVRAGRLAVKELALSKRDVTVRVVTSTGHVAVPGMRVSVARLLGDRYILHWPALDDVTTDESGVAVVRDTAAGDRLELTLRHPHEIADLLPPGTVVPGVHTERRRVDPHEHDVTVRVSPPRTVSWRIEEGGIAPPANGTYLRVLSSRASGGGTCRSAVMRGSTIVAEGWTGARAFALAADDLIAELRVGPGASDGEPTRFVVRPTISLRVLDRCGSPAEGVALVTLTPGNILTGPVAITDDAGHAVVRPLCLGRVRVVAAPHELALWSARASVPLAEFDLSAGDAEATVVLDHSPDLVLDVSADGEPCVPVGLRVSADGLARDFDCDDAMPGRVRVHRTVRVSRAGSLRIQADGFGTVAVPVPYGASGSEAPISVAMQRCGTLATSVRASRETPGVHAELEYEDRGPVGDATPRWTVPLRLGVPVARLGRSLPVALTEMRAGRYRLVDRRSGFATKPVELRPGGATSVTLDLTQGRTVALRVRLPDLAPRRPTRVHVALSGDSAPPPRELRVGTSFVVKVHVPTGCAGTATVTHPLCAPQVVDLVCVEDSVDVELVPTGLVSFAVEPALRRAPSRIRPLPGTVALRSPLRVLVHTGDPDGVDAMTIEPVVQNGIARFGGVPPGVYTLEVDRPGFAPETLEHVQLGDSHDHDLGTIVFEAGATLRIRLGYTDDRVAPATVTTVRSAGSLPCRRIARAAAGAREVVVRGLGPGSHEIVVAAVSHSSPHERRELWRGPIEVRADGLVELDATLE